MFPAWVWAQRERSYLSGPQVRFLCGSYNHDLALASSNMTRRLILSPWYQKYWGKRFSFRADQNTKTKFDTSEGGARLATSVGGSLLGIGGDILVVDDPHNVASAESDAERVTALNWWRELSTTRLNDPKQSAVVVIMQRLAEGDVSGEILSSEWSSDWCHLMIPAEYEWRRHCISSIGWQDPRGLDDDGKPLIAVASDGDRYPRDDAAAQELERREGELFWPERFGRAELARIKADFPGQRLQRRRAAHIARILRRVQFCQLVPVLRIEDAPHRRMLGLAVGPALVHGDAHSSGALADKALAVAVHQDAVAGICLE